MNLLQKLKLINQKDSRRNFMDFFYCFNLDLTHSSSSIYLQLEDVRTPQKKLQLSRCMELYDYYTHDYRGYSTNQLEKLFEENNNWLLKHKRKPITKRGLAKILWLSEAQITKIFSGTSSNYEAVVDTLLFHLIPDPADPKTITNTQGHLKKLYDILMFLQSLELSLREISFQTNIPLSQLKNLETAVAKRTTYYHVYDKLVLFREKRIQENL